MELLDPNTSPATVLKEFPMLEDVTIPELKSIHDDCEDSDQPEDQPLLRATEILLNAYKNGTYYVIDEDDDIPGGATTPAL